MKYFGKVFVEYFDKEEREWQLSAISWWKYLIARLSGDCGSANANSLKYDFRHVPRKNVKFM